MNKYVLIFIGFFCVVQSALSQIPGSSNIVANIVDPLFVQKNANVENGIVAIIYTGDLKFSPSGSNSLVGNFKVPSSSGTLKVAFFYIGNSLSFSYSVVPSSDKDIGMVNGSEPLMTLSTFMGEPTMIAGEGPSAGIYVQLSPLNVTINYN